MNNITANTNKFIMGLFVSVIIFSIFQLLMGADLTCLFLINAANMFLIAAMYINGGKNLVFWLILYVHMSYVLLCIISKTLFGQTIESNLYAPVTSFSVVAVTAAATLVATIIYKCIKIKRSLFTTEDDVNYLKFLSIISFSFGTFIGLFLATTKSDISSVGFAGIFHDLVFFAIIARTAAVLKESNNKVKYDKVLLIMIVMSCFLGLVKNSKTFVALPVVSFFITQLFFGCKFKLKNILIIGLAGLLMVGVLGPFIHAYRYMGERSLPFKERIALMYSGTKELIRHPEDFKQISEMATLSFGGGYYNYFGNTKGQIILARYVQIQQIDPLIKRVDEYGTMGPDAVLMSIGKLVPHFLLSKKIEYISDYYILKNYGLIYENGGKYPTLPMFGQYYAAYKMIGVFLLTIIGYVSVFFILTLYFGDLRNNIYAIFLFCVYVVLGAPGGDLETFLGYPVRSFLTLAIFIIFIKFLYYEIIHGGLFNEKK